MNKGYILLTTLLISIFSLGLSAQSKYPAPPENDSKEVMDKYQKAVDQWYLENPKTDEIIKEVESEKIIEKEIIEGPNLTSADIPSDATVWKLSKIEIIENGTIDEKLNEFQQAFVDKHTATKLRIFIHNDKHLYVRMPKGVVKKFVLTISDKNLSLQEDNCPKCTKHISNLITYNSSSFITEKEFTDDNGNHFKVKFSYTSM